MSVTVVYLACQRYIESLDGDFERVHKRNTWNRFLNLPVFHSLQFFHPL
jgi:hypothetical protein